MLQCTYKTVFIAGIETLNTILLKRMDVIICLTILLKNYLNR